MIRRTPWRCSAATASRVAATGSVKRTVGPPLELVAVEGVVRPISPIFSPATGNTRVAPKRPASSGSALASTLALITGTVRPVRKRASSSGPSSNSWLPRVMA